MTNLKGRVALVTGGSRGIGRAIALELACRGAAVAISYRAAEAEAEAVAQRIQEIGPPCLVIKGDVAKKEEARAIVQRVVDEWKRIDVLVNNAGITRDKSFRKMADDDWADVISVNLNGTFYCTSAAIPYMIEQKFGRIVNISSYVGQAGNFGQANYAASKGGIIAFTKTVAIEMAKHNITVNSIAPGFTLTEMLAQVPQNIQEQIKTKIPMGRFAQPEEVAKAVAFLTMDADYITGQQINVNGGIYM